MIRRISIVVFLGVSISLSACGSGDSSRKVEVPDAGPDGGGGVSGAGGGTVSGSGGSKGSGGAKGSGGNAGTGGTATGGTATGGASDGGGVMEDASSPIDASADGGDFAIDAATDGAVADGSNPDASTQRYVWVSLRVDDCAGLDDAALGFTTASDSPVPSNCNAGTVGRAAVCWDQTNFHNELSAQPGCTYKTVQSSACTQGPRPGYMWACVDRATDGGVTDETPSPDFGDWRFVRIGDCGGNDNAAIGYTTTSKLPLAGDCTSANRGYAAVCWDQVYHSNPGVSGAGCTYKTITAASCTGGSNAGALYVCNAP